MSADTLMDDNDVNDNDSVNCLDGFLKLCSVCFATVHIVTLGKVKVKCTVVQALRLCSGRTTHRGVEVQLYPFLTTAVERGEESASRPGRSLPPGKTRYPLYRRLCGSQGRSGQVRKISPPPGFDSRTVQPVASRYTDFATRPTFTLKNSLKFET